MEEGVFLVLEDTDVREDFLVCSCLDRRQGEEKLGGERERFLVCPSLEQFMAREGLGTEGVLSPGAGLCCSITCTVRKIVARSVLVQGWKDAGKIPSVETAVEDTSGEEPSTAVEGIVSSAEGTFVG